MPLLYRLKLSLPHRSHYSCDCASCGRQTVMFPHSNHSPTCSAKLGGLPPIAISILLQLWQPVALIRLRIGRVFRATMPEAAIYKDGDPGRHEDDIDSPAFDSAMETETKALRENRRPKRTFRFRIFAGHSAHDLRASEWPVFSTFPFHVWQNHHYFIVSFVFSSFLCRMPPDTAPKHVP